MNILIIEDVESDFLLVSRYLHQQDPSIHCHRVADVINLEKALVRGGWNAVITDYHVVGMEITDGLELIKRYTADLPIILVSGTIGEEQAVELLKQGVWDFVLKDRLTRLGPSLMRSLKESADRREKREIEAAFHESQKRLAFAMEATNDAIFEFDLHNTDTFCSARFYTMLGYEPNEIDLTSESWANLLHPDDRIPARTIMEEYIRGVRKSHEAELRYRTKEGPFRWILSRGKLMETLDGEPTSRVIGTHSDITTRKQTEEALRTSQQHYRTLAETSPAGVFQVDILGMTSYVNTSWCQIAGMTTVEAIGEGWLSAVHPDDRERLKAQWNIDRSTGNTSRQEYRFLRPDGSIVWVIGQATPEKDASGQVTGYIGVIIDITERKKAEDALLTSEKTLRSYIDNAPEGIIITDTMGLITDVNPAAARMLEYPTNVLKGMPLLDTLTEESRAGGEIALRELSRNGLDKRELLMITTTGQEVVVSAAAAQLPDNRLIWFCRDITDTRHNEDEKARLKEQLNQLQKMESIGRLAGGVAHDFNNLLTIILGNSEMAMSFVSPGHVIYQALEQIQKTAQHSANLTRQLLAFARKQTVLPQVLNLNSAVRNMFSLLRRLIGEDINLQLIPGENLRPVCIDPTQVDQILANLCVNARDAIKGVGRVTIITGNVTFDSSEARPGLGAGDYVMLAMSDTGCGMSPDTVQHIFEPFFTTKGVGEGTGLGLSMVYGAVQQNNGSIEVESELNVGTTFRIYFPACGDMTEETTAESRSQQAEKGMGTILLVEDEPGILRITTSYLETLGYKVLPARSPMTALAFAEDTQQEITMLITDVVMPEMNGNDLAERILELRPGLGIIFMSGYTPNVIAQRGVMARSTHFMQKPFTMESLASKIKNVLDCDKS
jgi:PAS domain S-box-containing protein